ncbi:MAG: M15 family metallopeptidase [Clostridia bacterium]|nr:M15 family metallopeptidase [Clostridia bacterium]
MKNRKKGRAILIFGIGAIVFVILLIVLMIVLIMIESPESSVSQVSQVDSQESKTSQAADGESSAVTVGGSVSSVPEEQNTVGLDENYERLILVNRENPLPENFDYTKNLVTIPKKYLNGNRDKMDKDAYPYAKAMVEAAWEDGVELYILSPYRSYSVQQDLFDNKVQRVIKEGTLKEKAEDEAATVVARPGTSEHHTGLAIDFNSVEEDFEDTPMFRWLQENAEDYGFILRYPKDKTDITGIIYEPWHYRFVGVNAARTINGLGITLEEYIQLKNEN